MNLTTISPIIAYSLNIQGNAQLWGKNTLIRVGKYQLENSLDKRFTILETGKFAAT
jgi:hypothetical protein